MRAGTPARWAAFDTAIGRCAVAWADEALTGVRLPQRDPTAPPRGWPPERFAEQRPAWVDHAIRSMQRHLAGQPQHLRELPLRMQGLGAFEQQVYTEARRLDPGQTCSYGELARRIGQASAARAVGAALGANPWPLIVPCHRVLAAGGKLGGFSAPGGVEAKRVLLLLESEMVPRAGDWFG